MTERQLKKNILALLHKMGFPAWSNGAGPFSPIGFPDIGFMAFGTTYYFEAKIGNNRPTKPQQAWLDKLNKWGERAVVVRTIEQVKSHLQLWLTTVD